MSENSDKYRTAIAAFDAVLDGVTDWGAQTPCEDWTATQLVGHVIGGLNMVTTGAFGESEEANAGDDPASSFRSARAAAEANFTDERLGEIVTSPMGDMPLDQMIGMFLANDMLIHTWDLAKASGQEVTLDQDLAQGCLESLEPIDAMLRQPGIFGPKVEPPEGADLQTRLMCFVGRDAH